MRHLGNRYGGWHTISKLFVKMKNLDNLNLEYTYPVNAHTNIKYAFLYTNTCFEGLAVKCLFYGIKMRKNSMHEQISLSPIHISQHSNYPKTEYSSVKSKFQLRSAYFQLNNSSNDKFIPIYQT